MMYAYSRDRENYYGGFQTREQAVDAVLREFPHHDTRYEPVWTAVRKPVDIDALVDDFGGFIIESLSERSGEEYSEYACDWPDTSPAGEQALDDAVRAAVVAWVMEYSPPSFFMIDSDTVDEHRLTRQPQAGLEATGAERILGSRRGEEPPVASETRTR